MPEATWWLFFIASIVVITTPGQDMILVMSRSIAQGPAAGVVTAAGVSIGLVGHTLLATLGLGAILRTSEWAFVALKLVGAAYLVWLGIKLLRTRDAELQVGSSTARSLRRLFADGARSGSEAGTGAARLTTFATFEHSDTALAPQGLHCLTVKSAALGQRADLTIFVPTQLTAQGPALGARDVPIVTLLHGVNGSHWAWAFKGGAHHTAARLIDAGAIPPMVLAMPSDGLWGDGCGYVTHAARDRAQDFERWIVEEVPAAVRQACAACTAALPQFIAGLSMGGFGALRLAGKHPRQYRAAAAHSAMTDIAQFDGLVAEVRTGWSSALPDTSVWEALRTSPGPLPALRLDCGHDDFLIEANRDLHQRLLEAGIDHVYEEFPGGHDWPYWARHFEDTLRFFGAALRSPAEPST